MSEFVQSPCINVCFLEGDDVCAGCYRHSDEITEWSEATSERRKAILATSAERRQAANKVVFK